MSNEDASTLMEAILRYGTFLDEQNIPQGNCYTIMRPDHPWHNTCIKLAYQMQYDRNILIAYYPNEADAIEAYLVDECTGRFKIRFDECLKEK